MWPFRTLLDSGATLAFGTDSPVTDIDPIDAVYTAVTRRDADTHEPLGGWLPEERITLAEALRATCGKFRARWAFMEGAAAGQGRRVEDLSMEEMEELWQLSKVLEGDSLG